MRKHETQAERRGVVGYQAIYVVICRCGWYGVTGNTRTAAEEDGVAHEVTDPAAY